MKIDNRTFKFAGSSADPNGNFKARFANDPDARPKVMTKSGHTNFVLVALPTPMTKAQAIQYLVETKPEGVNIAALQSKSDYLTKQEAKLNGTAVPGKRGRPRKVVVDAVSQAAKSAETPATPNLTSTETPKAASIVNTIVTKARTGNSLRAKATATAVKVAAAKR